MAPTGWHPMEPTELAATIYGVALAFSILSTVVLGLRVYARLRMKQFSLEDWLMCIGWSLFLWQVFFLSGFVFIKISICLTLLRIAVVKWHRNTLWALIVISIVSTIFVDCYIFLQCRPIAATWGEVEGICVSKTIYVSITFTISGFNLVTDILTSLLPFLMLRGVQMSKQKKTAIIGILSLGVLASIATIARLPYAQAYFAADNYMEGVGNIMLWTVCECDLALIAGSLPMLRTLFKSIKGSLLQKSTHNTQSTEFMDLGKPQKIRDRSDGEREREHIVITVDHHIDHEPRPSVTPNSDLQPQYQAKSYC
ncbi:hypothetical protein DHEL01_v210542 [Diaporthe helianthi]|uniref:Rhodopsin domain-containing protein n=1 Tax=Diaporthe helianthi TaxID=158607 RepID=A0A2P5HLE6_DIAHE|nr:hypothetical protein DHEL01_v210542 [Diaporthe helianthi]